MSDHKTPLELVEEVRSLVYICAGCQSCEFVGGHLLGPAPVGPITALCDAIESQAVEIERLRKHGRYLLAVVDVSIKYGWEMDAIAQRDLDEARAALERKP